MSMIDRGYISPYFVTNADIFFSINGSLAGRLDLMSEPHSSGRIPAPNAKGLAASKYNHLCGLGLRPKAQVRPLMHAARLLGEGFEWVGAATKPHPKPSTISVISKAKIFNWNIAFPLKSRVPFALPRSRGRRK